MAPENQMTCPSCNQPVKSGQKFCENCGTKIEPAPVCAECGTPLPPQAKFCESCGKPAGQLPPANAEPLVAQESPAVPPEPATGVLPTPQAPVPADTVAAPATAGGSRNLIIAGIIVLVVLAAVAFFVVLPILSGPGSAPAGSEPGPAQAGSSPSGGSAGTSAVAATPAPASATFVVKPTSLIPANYMITYQAERNGITGLVTVTFAGGPGINGIRETVITLTKSDGTVETRSWKPKQNGDSTTIQGTIGTDHLEAVANFYNGDQYRVLDQLFEYKKKN